MNIRGRPPAADAEAGRRRSSRLRLRVAWMYYAEDMTQGAIAENLGIGRVTVTRLLADARAMHEVSIALSREIAELPRLELALEANVLTDAVKANGFGVIDAARMAESLTQIATTYTFATTPDAALYFTDAYLPDGGFKLGE